MLRLVRLRGAGSFNPKNEGPLMIGCSSVTGAAARGAVVFCGAEGGDAGGGGAGGEMADAGRAGTTAVAAASVDAVPACGAGNSVAPHMPQKRFVPGFSFPQRGQRTN